MDRRQFLQVSSLFGLSTFLPNFVFAADQNENGPIFITIIQRGAMDGLALLAPVKDPEYLKIRPNIHFTSAELLEDHFALNPGAKDIMKLWKNKELAFIVQSGSPDGTRSHFDAQDYLETGTPGVKTTNEGFLNRALSQMPKANQSFQGLALQPAMPRILRGPFETLSFNSIKDYNLSGPFVESKSALQNFEAMYEQATDKALRESGINAFRSMRSLENSNNKQLNEWMKRFPKHTTGRRLAEIGWLIKSNVGLKIAVTDTGGWDTHVYQCSENGKFSDRMTELTESIDSLRENLEKDWGRIVLLTVTEFGRTAAENGTRVCDDGDGRKHKGWKSLRQMDKLKE